MTWPQGAFTVRANRSSQTVVQYVHRRGGEQVLSHRLDVLAETFQLFHSVFFFLIDPPPPEFYLLPLPAALPINRPIFFVRFLPCFFIKLLPPVTVGAVIEQGIKIFARHKRPLRDSAEVRPMLDRPFVGEWV